MNELAVVNTGSDCKGHRREPGEVIPPEITIPMYRMRLSIEQARELAAALAEACRFAAADTPAAAATYFLIRRIATLRSIAVTDTRESAEQLLSEMTHPEKLEIVPCEPVATAAGQPASLEGR